MYLEEFNVQICIYGIPVHIEMFSKSIVLLFTFEIRKTPPKTA